MFRVDLLANRFDPCDENVTKKSRIYKYLLTGGVRNTHIRAFDPRDMPAACERQVHRRNLCGKVFEFDKMHGDHIRPWSDGGHTTPDNLQMLCVTCNLKKARIEWQLVCLN